MPNTNLHSFDAAEVHGDICQVPAPRLSDGPQDVYAAVPATINLPRGVLGDKAAAILQLFILYTGLTPEAREGHWVNVHHRKLVSTVGSRYAPTVRWLKANGFIEVNPRYSTGREGRAAFTKSYRLAKAHRHGRAKLYRINSVCARERAIRTFEIDPENLGQSGVYYCEMFSRFAIDRIAVGQDKALADDWTQWTIARFVSGKNFAVRCDFGRYHSLMTQLPRTARRYLSVDGGQKLAIADVSACQPLLLGLLAGLAGIGRSDTSKASRETNVLPYGAHFSRSRSEFAVDIQRWLSLCESREIYDYLQREVSKMPCRGRVVGHRKSKRRGSQVTRPGRPQRPSRFTAIMADMSSTAFKRSSLIPIFDTVKATLANPVFQIIARDFPSIARFILRAKAERHQNLARLLQRAESELMIDRLGAILQRDYPSEPVQPIHDALLVRQVFADEACEVIRSLFASVGLHPQVKNESA